MIISPLVFSNDYLEVEVVITSIVNDVSLSYTYVVLVNTPLDFRIYLENIVDRNVLEDIVSLSYGMAIELCI